MTNTLQRGETAAYQFTMMTNALNHTISLESVAGTPLVRLRNDPHLPLDIYNTYAYGQDGSYTPAWTGVTNVINNPANGFYSLALLANGASTNWAPLQYTPRLHAEPLPSNLCFDGCNIQVMNQGRDWRVFAVTVPPNALGWDLRILNLSTGMPRLVIRRDLPPTSYGSTGGFGFGFSSPTWPSGYQLAPINDWTLLNEADGSSITGRVFQVSMGNPLQPGTYYVGITNLDSTQPGLLYRAEPRHRLRVQRAGPGCAVCRGQRDRGLAGARSGLVPPGGPAQ